MRVVTDPALELRIARLELQLLEKEAQVAALQARLDEARREIVRALAKLQTVATPAEAASAIAEAEIALQSLREATGHEAAGEVAQVKQLLELSAQEFDKGNYGGALYLANQAKGLAGAGRGRLLSARPGSLRPGEVLFTAPLRLQATGRGNLREGPGTEFGIVLTVEKATPLQGHGYLGDWVRVSDDGGRTGWMHLLLLNRRP